MNGSVTQLVIPDNPELQAKSAHLAEMVLRWKVTDQASLEEAGRMVTALTSFETQIEDTFRPFVKTTDQLHTQALGLLNKFKGPVALAVAYLKGESKAYLVEAARRHQAAEAARIKAEQEALEARRKTEAEAIAKQERLKREAEEKQAAADKLLEEAAQAAEMANNASVPPGQQNYFKLRSDELLQAAVKASPAPPPPWKILPVETIEKIAANVMDRAFAQPPPTSVPGLGSRKVWKWRCTNKASVPETYKLLDEKQLNSAATGSRPEIPGIEYFQETEVVKSRSSL